MEAIVHHHPVDLSGRVKRWRADPEALPALIRDLRCHGWTNVLASSPAPVSRAGLMAAMHSFAKLVAAEAKSSSGRN